MGICAGAYLPLKSSIPPLSSFNLIDVRISNISTSAPPGLLDIERYTVPYGCSLVYHPARGPIDLDGERHIMAPLYGGPVLLPSKSSREILRFEALIDETEQLVDSRVCEEILIGKSACLEDSYGEGRLLLISPHLEHPDFPEANEFLDYLLQRFPCNNGVIAPTENDGNEKYADIDKLRRIVADLRVLANALGSQSWKVGIKYWENEKLLFFIEAIRNRLQQLRKNRQEGELKVSRKALAALVSSRELLRIVNQGSADSKIIQELTDSLSRGASMFLNSYFKRLSLAH